METHSPYIRYRASQQLDRLVVEYIAQMESSKPRPDKKQLLMIMELFVAESVDLFVNQAADHVQLRSGYLSMINSLSSLVQKSSMMLVGRVAKKMDVNDHRNAAQYMKQVRLALEEEGEMIGYIAFPIDAEFAELGWNTREKMLEGLARDPEVLQDAVTYLHAVIDVANKWIFENPMEILQLGPVMRTLTTTTVSTVRKTTHSLIETLVPKISEHQTTAAADYFSDIVGPGPFQSTYGEIPSVFLSR